MLPVKTALSHLVSDAVSHSNHFWFPETAGRVAQFAWENAGRYSFSPENYGTHRWYHKNPKRERIRLAHFELSNSSEFLIEVLPNSTRRYYERVGLVFSDHSPITAFPAALDLIRTVPSLYNTISLYLRSLHILEAPTDEHDVSHSDPSVPFSIFVSVPPSGARCRMRLAESIVHESMHLQLSAIERLLPLVDQLEALHCSPWQQTLRPPAGILHGLYVFTIIHNFFGMAVHTGSLTSEEFQFANSRRRQIANEVHQLSSHGWTHSLSTIGRNLASRLVRYIQLQR